MFEHNIVVLICYFGKLPWYFDYFMHSCRFNPSVQFRILIDDTSYKKVLPHNVELIFSTLKEISHRATLKLGFPVNIKKAYKLCDFKPAYGFLFPELTEGYDFWAHGDIDVIFGNIRSFISNEMLNHYDIINVRHDFLTGYFLLFRNDQKTNTLFKKSNDFRKVFTSGEHYCFDETNFQHSEFAKNKDHHKLKVGIDSMNHVIRRLQDEEKIKAYFDLHVIEGVPGRLKWENGRLFYRSKYEVLLYHMVRFKSVYRPESKAKNIPDRFTISKKRIYHKK